ncbi:MAG: hypothetical protein KQI35_05215 [Bacteroidetes bacterium]|nr:hypothetical protein [Bacteroidota bacterium]
MKQSTFLVIIIIVIALFPVYGQNTLGSITDDETDLYAQTKQVNQFFRRFNNEEDKFGNRYYPGDSLYRDNAFRKVYLEMLFDKESPFIQKGLKEEFINEVTSADNPVFLDFHGNNWFAELPTSFKYYKKKENLLLFMQLEQENLGYKWVITNVYFDKFLKQFNKGDKEVIAGTFLHPMSHELDFMNIYKVFRDPKYIEYYASKTFKPDYRTLLFYEVKMGNMEYVSVGPLKFHFFQVDGWYFEVTFFNRPGNNSGWLISKLYRISDSEKDALIRFYLP